MDDSITETRILQYRYEVLRAKIDIREFFLKTSVKEVYENIGQVLSIVRMQLAFFEDPAVESKEDLAVESKFSKISQSGDLLGQSIKDLRHMCRSFYPDADILKGNGFIEGLAHAISFLYPNKVAAIKQTGDTANFKNSLKLILFNIIQDIIGKIKQIAGEYKNMMLSFAETEIICRIRYTGKKIGWSKPRPAQPGKTLALEERVYLIGGDLHCKSTRPGINLVTLQAPLNLNLYE